MVLVPRGEFVKDVDPAEALEYIVGDKKRKKLKVKDGYLEGDITSSYGHFKFKIVFENKRIVSAEVLKTNTKTEWTHYEALRIIACLLILAVKTKNVLTEIKLYKLNRKVMELAKEILNVEDITIGSVDEVMASISDILKGGEGDTFRNVSVEDVLKDLDNFTGIVTGEKGNYFAKVFVRNGEIIGAFVRDGDEEIKGTMALYHLDVECDVVKVKRTMMVIVPDDCKVEMQEIEIDAKLDERLERLLDALRSMRS